MEPSDWITVGALCISGIALFTSVLVSIAGFVFNYWTNKANIRARRAEIAMENSIEALREITEKMFVFAQTVPRNDPHSQEAAANLFEALQKNRLYYSQHIGNELLDVAYDFIQLSNRGTATLSTAERETFSRALSKFGGIVDRLQKHLGIEFARID